MSDLSEETRIVLKEAARQILELGDVLAEISPEERRVLQAEIAKGARQQPTRHHLFDLSTMLRYAWGDALWNKD